MNKLYEENDIQAIANAIRSKNGSSDTYTVAQMGTAISNIPSGGGGFPANTKFAYNDSSVFNTLIPQIASVSSQYTDMSYLFYHSSGLTSVDMTDWDTSNVTAMNQMFGSCSSLQSANLSGLDTSSVVSFDSMFNGCGSLSSVNLRNWVLDNSLNLNFYRMFYGCSNLTSIDLSSWTDNTSLSGYVIPYNISGMFQGCTNLQTLDLSSLSLSSATTYSNMFGSSSSNRIPANCLIYVELGSYSWIMNNFSWLTNVQVVY